MIVLLCWYLFKLKMSHRGVEERLQGYPGLVRQHILGFQVIGHNNQELLNAWRRALEQQGWFLLNPNHQVAPMCVSDSDSDESLDQE